MATLIEAKYKVTTPMFCGGAQPKNEAELRLPSFKGVIRFWWRSLAWQKYAREGLDALRKKENSIFGSTETGQPKVRIRLENFLKNDSLSSGKILKDGSGKTVGEGARYLGYGVMEAYPRRGRGGQRGTQAGQLTRPCLVAPFSFQVQIRVKGLDGEELESVLGAVKGLGLFGGMGSKSRKGYGTLSLQELRTDENLVWETPSDLNGLKREILETVNGFLGEDYPPFTAFSKKTRILVLKPHGVDDPLKALDVLGKEMVRFRSLGISGFDRENRIIFKDSGRPEKAEGNFRGDHDLVLKAIDGTVDRAPRRIAFGLPHNYHFSSLRKSVEVKAEHFERRGSPLFIHVHDLRGTPVLVLAFLPSLFLPEKRRRVKVGKRNNVKIPGETELYQPVEEFLRRLAQKREEFETMEVTP